MSDQVIKWLGELVGNQVFSQVTDGLEVTGSAGHGVSASLQVLH